MFSFLNFKKNKERRLQKGYAAFVEEMKKVKRYYMLAKAEFVDSEMISFCHEDDVDIYIDGCVVHPIDLARANANCMKNGIFVEGCAYRALYIELSEEDNPYEQNPPLTYEQFKEKALEWERLRISVSEPHYGC